MADDNGVADFVVELETATKAHETHLRRVVPATLRDKTNVSEDELKQWMKRLTHGARTSETAGSKTGHLPALDETPPAKYTNKLLGEEAFDHHVHPVRQYNRHVREQARHRGFIKATITIIQETLPTHLYRTLMCDDPEDDSLLKHYSEISLYAVIKEASNHVSKPNTTDEDQALKAASESWTHWDDGIKAMQRHVANMELRLEKFYLGRTAAQQVKYIIAQVQRVGSRDEFKELDKKCKEWLDKHPVGGPRTATDLADLWTALDEGNAAMTSATGYTAEALYEEPTQDVNLALEEVEIYRQVAADSLRVAQRHQETADDLRSQLAVQTPSSVPSAVTATTTSDSSVVTSLTGDQTAFLATLGYTRTTPATTTPAGTRPRGGRTPFEARDLTAEQQPCNSCRKLGIGRECYRANQDNCKSNPKFEGERGYLNKQAVKAWEVKHRPRLWKNAE